MADKLSAVLEEVNALSAVRRKSKYMSRKFLLRSPFFNSNKSITKKELMSQKPIIAERTSEPNGKQKQKSTGKK